MEYKIEQAVLRLKTNVEQNKKHELIQFENGVVIINKNCSENWIVLLLYFVFLLIVPIGILLFLIINRSDYLIIILLILSIYSFFLLFRKMIIGDATLEINLNEKYIKSENNYFLIKKIFKFKKIDFIEIAKSDIREQIVYYKYSNESKWLRLSINNKNGKQFILTDFKINYPDKTIAKDVKNVIDATIIRNKNN